MNENEVKAAAVQAEPSDAAAFTTWLAREMPAGTVIGDPAWWAQRILGRFGAMRSDAFRQECDDADELMRMLGLDPDACRTDGGSINLRRVKTFLAERAPVPAGAGEALRSISAKAALAANMCDNEGRAEGFRHIQQLADAALAAPAPQAEVTWRTIDSAPKHEPLWLYSPEWVDADFNPTGTREGFLHDDDAIGWLTAAWNSCQDCWDALENQWPTHWMRPSSSPAVDAARTAQDGGVQ